MKKYTIILIVGILLAAVISIVMVLTIFDSSKYSDNYSANDLYYKVAESFSTDGGVKFLDSDVILEFTDEDTAYIRDYTVIKSNNAKNLNEIGIFRVEDGKSDEIKSLIEVYVINLQKAYRAMDYFPEEVEKIEFATVRVLGNYVIYSFLNEKDTDSFYRAVLRAIEK